LHKTYAKLEQYLKIVRLRKLCKDCNGVINPYNCKKEYDSSHIGPWSRWQGNLDAQLMVIGQDWGTPEYYKRWYGLDDPSNYTCVKLAKLLSSIGIIIPNPTNFEQDGEIFLTNAILCLKPGNLQDPVKGEWFQNCGKKFLKPLIQLVKPKILVALGEKAYIAIMQSYDIHYKRPKTYGMLVDTVGESDGVKLPDGILLFPVFHCGARVINTKTRTFPEQLIDWKPIKQALALNQ
jgi:DNA polymerase